MKLPFLKTSKKLLKVACISACLVTAWGAGEKADAVYAPPDKQYMISWNITAPANTTHTYVYTSYLVNTCYWEDSLTPAADGSYNFTTSGWDSVDNLNYGAIFLYNDNDNIQHVGISSPDNNISGKSWETTFPDINENDVASWVSQANDYTDHLKNMFFNYAYTVTAPISYNLGGSFPPTPLTLWGFSTASEVGSATAEYTSSSVPLPATLPLLVTGMGVLAYMRRKMTIKV